MAHHAVVFGASGILGWAVVNEILLNYPTKGTYSKVSALTNRPLSIKNSLWPEPAEDVPKLSVISGIDLTKYTFEQLTEILKSKINDISTVTHVFYFAYQYDPDSPTETKINRGMLQRGLGALEVLAPNLSYVILPTGTKGYGVHIRNLEGFKAPYKESMGELPEPYRSELFYFALRDELNRLQKGKPWKWAEVRCDIVNGYVPNSNPHNLPGRLIGFLSLYKFMHDNGHPDAQSKQVRFPFPPASWEVLSNDAGQDTFARFSIHLCLHPDSAGNSNLYNIADETQPRSFAERWPYLCSLFGLEGIAPVDSSSPEYITPNRFSNKYPDQVKLLKVEKGVTRQDVASEEGLEMWMEHLNFNHDLVIKKAKRTGFLEEMTLQEDYNIVLGRYVKAKKAYIGI